MTVSPAVEPAGALHHLRSGSPVWTLPQDAAASLSSLPAPGSRIDADIAIIGAGITGAMLAERLSRPGPSPGRRIAVIDRHLPAHGSTAASTALVLWEIDTPLVELEARLGFDRAAQAYRRSHAATQELAALVAALGIDCDLRAAPSFYLSGNRLDPLQLQDEHRIRRRAGLPGDYLPAGSLPQLHGLATPAAALLSPDGWDLDPVRLTLALLAHARQRGTRLLAPLQAVEYEFTAQGVTVHCANGVAVRAAQLILATGYEMPPFVRVAMRHQVQSTWALATVPQAEAMQQVRPLLPAMLWEAAEPYLYLRATADGRLMIGGEDAPVAAAAQRKALMPVKTARLQQRLAELLPGADTRIATSWSGRFGMTTDGLPLIGAVPDHPGCFAAYGYGGNGITFSVIAADLLAGLLTGGPGLPVFALDR